MMEIDEADFHITHRLDDDEEQIFHLRTDQNCPNHRDHLTVSFLNAGVCPHPVRALAREKRPKSQGLKPAL